MSESLESSLRFHIDMLCREARTPDSPGYYKTQEYLKSFIRKIGLEPKEHSFDVLGRKACLNIYGENRPQSNEPRLLIGAHYESRESSGLAADDNASAVAVALELAKALLEKDAVAFTLVLFDMEEIYKFVWQDLQGSKAFAKAYARPLDRVLVMDLVGGVLAPHFENVYLQFGSALPKIEAPNLRFLHLPMQVLEPVGSIGARSDYDGFRKRKIPFTFISSGTPWYYHTPADTPEILNFKKMSHLTETLITTLSQPKKASTSEDHLTAFQTFLKLLEKTPTLKSPLTEKLIQKNRLPSRLEIIRLYAHLLPTLRHHGPKLWPSTK